MSQNWGIWVTVLVICNILGMVWLLKATAKQPKDELEKETTGHEWDGISELNTPMPRWWLWLFYSTIVLALVYLALYPGLGLFKGYLGWTQENQYEESLAQYKAKSEEYFKKYAEIPHDELAQDPQAMKTGRNIFLNNCAACHGSDARGAKGFPNLTDDDWLYGGEEADLVTTLTNGRSGVMPALGAAFTPEELESVVQFILSQTDRQTASEEVVAAGKAKFDVMCIACHGPDAKGNKFLGAPNLTDNIWLYGGEAADIKETLLKGRNGLMPEHKSKFSPAQIHLMAAYVKSLGQQN